MLSAEERKTLELGSFEGLTQHEVASRLQQPLGTIKSRTRRALQKMASAFG